MIPHSDEKFTLNLPVCLGKKKDQRCPQYCPAENRGAVCLMDNVSASHHANAGYCPLGKFPANAPKPEEWDELERVATGLPFDPKTPPAEIIPRLSADLPGDAWTKWENVREAYRLAMADAARNYPEFPEGSYHGRGIVIPAGGKLLEAAYVTIRVLRFVGCTLPIELWHLPDETLEDWHREALQGYGVAVVNADDVIKRHPVRRMGGWELKAYAVMHSAFAETLLLDADCYPVRDPSCLFDSPQYRETGAIFWPDKKDFDLTKEQCEILGIDWRDEPDIESGEIVIDKKRCWRELSLTRWINDHSDFYYKIVFGDKATHHVAWRFLGSEYAMPPGRWDYARPAMIQKDFAGHPLFIHRSEGKLTLSDEGGAVFGAGRTGQFPAKERFNPKLPLEDIAWSFLDDLRQIRDAHHNHGRIFARVYANQEWGNGSGPGSAPEATAPYRELLERVLHSGRIKRVVDLGCGDWQFSRLVNWTGIDYLGVDCVGSLIEANQKRFGATNVRFQHADLMEFDPPPCDLIIVKDVLQHWPTADVKAFLSRMAGREMLITNTVEQPRQRQTNSDIRAGDFRPLDLTAVPYSIARAKPLLDWIVGVDDHKQTLMLPGPIDLVRGAVGITRALMAKPGSKIAEHRREICETCDKAVRALGIFQKCGVCGCHIKSKSKTPGEACPIGKWPKVGTRIAFVQLGRAGDILILIPALKFLVEMGVKVTLVTRPEYAPIAGGLPGIEIMPVDLPFTDWPKAETMARGIADEVRVTQCGFNNRKRSQPNFAMEGWHHTGVPISLFHGLPLVLENRDAAAEAKIADEHGSPQILFCATGNSSPYADGPSLLAELRRGFGDENVLDLGTIKAPRIQDMLGLYERAKVLISIDTATLHLGYATGIPTVALVSDLPDGASPTRSHWIERMTYSESRTAAGRKRLVEAVGKIVGGPFVRGHLDTPWSKIRDNVFVGNHAAASDVNWLRHAGIQTIINLCEFPDPDCGVPRLHPELIDGPGNSAEEIEAAINAAAGSIRDGNRVLIHCAAGHSRAPYITARALVRVDGKPFADCLAEVRQCRPTIEWPNRMMMIYGTGE